MTEQIINASSLPAYLSKIISAEKVRIREINNIVTIEPVEFDEESLDCPLFGIAEGSKLTVEKFLAMSLEDKELEEW